ncbi:unnamed protein product [Acanthoscelides obtectus]|uniref:Periodic tryptophan protein 1 homolog n=1 Tax=Acanthoscelides obtectus TaxID=200917 RepID=A0A9P0JV06_ACAOB|nr:unnamed protein product [Acanthoscelides obtectus]CAK1667318.1 Periodic tryptophan protein 1 homolog [Acanthoscelides obtectus]
MEEEGSQNSINFVPCIRWVRRGVASEKPTEVKLTRDELTKIIKENKEKLEEEAKNVQEEPMDADQAAGDEYNFEQYDEDDNKNAESVIGITSLATEVEEDADDDSEKEDDIIKPTDNLILVGHVEKDASVLEVHIYNEEEESFYVHHDIFLPSFPLCLEWLNYEPNSPKGNYCAVGSLSPIIEVWDIDLVNVLEPAFTLGRSGSRKKNKERIGHTDAVLALAWNKTFDHVIASGSADHSILLWDMEKQVPNTTITAFGEKVQCLDWHRLESQTLLAGGCDSTARIFDCRTPEPHQKWSLDGEAERLYWNPLEPFAFVVGTSKGTVQCFDCRKGQLWIIEAHSKEVTGLAISDRCPGLMVTASPDEMVKTWDYKTGAEPRLVQEKEYKMGNIHCLELCPDTPFVVALGGDNKSHNFTVFDLRNGDVIKHTFAERSLVQLVAEEGGGEGSSDS